MEDIVYKSDPKVLNRIWDLPEDTFRLLCPICNGPVVFAPTWERAKKLAVHPGAHCSIDKMHLNVLFELAPPKK